MVVNSIQKLLTLHITKLNMRNCSVLQQKMKQKINLFELDLYVNTSSHTTTKNILNVAKGYDVVDILYILLE